MGTIARASFVVLLALMVAVGFYLSRQAGIFLAVLLFPLLFVVAGGLIRRGLFLAYSTFLLTVAIRTVLMAVLVTPGYPSERAARIAISLASPLAALTAVAGGVIVVLYVASDWLLSMSEYLGTTRGQAMRVLASLVVGMHYAYQIIEDGRIVITSSGDTMSTIGGPGLLVIRPANAAVLEMGGMITNVVGPGIMLTRLFERVKKAVDLRRQWGMCSGCEVVTREGVPLHLEARFCHRIETAQLSSLAPAGPSPATLPNPRFADPLPGQPEYEQDTVFRAVYEAGADGWTEATTRAVDAALHDAVSRRSLTDLFGDPADPAKARPEALREVADEACQDAWRRTTVWGVCVESVDIVKLELPQELRERAVAAWEAAAERDLIRSKGRAEAEVIDAIETVKLGARTRTLQDFADFAERAAANLSPEHVGVFIALLEKLAVEMSRDRATALRYLHILEAMSRNPDAKVILSTGGADILIDARD